MIDTIAPVKKDIYKELTILGNPKNNPRRNTSFTSPKPIPRPFVIRNKKRKNEDAPNAEIT